MQIVYILSRYNSELSLRLQGTFKLVSSHNYEVGRSRDQYWLVIGSCQQYCLVIGPCCDP